MQQPSQHAPSPIAPASAPPPSPPQSWRGKRGERQAVGAGEDPEPPSPTHAAGQNPIWHTRDSCRKGNAGRARAARMRMRQCDWLQAARPLPPVQRLLSFSPGWRCVASDIRIITDRPVDSARVAWQVLRAPTPSPPASAPRRRCEPPLSAVHGCCRHSRPPPLPRAEPDTPPTSRACAHWARLRDLPRARARLQGRRAFTSSTGCLQHCPFRCRAIFPFHHHDHARLAFVIANAAPCFCSCKGQPTCIEIIVGEVSWLHCFSSVAGALSDSPCGATSLGRGASRTMIFFFPFAAPVER